MLDRLPPCVLRYEVGAFLSNVELRVLWCRGGISKTVGAISGRRQSLFVHKMFLVWRGGYRRRRAVNSWFRKQSAAREILLF
jgi:hypothetical protein